MRRMPSRGAGITQAGARARPFLMRPDGAERRFCRSADAASLSQKSGTSRKHKRLARSSPELRRRHRRSRVPIRHPSPALPSLPCPAIWAWQSGRKRVGDCRLVPHAGQRRIRQRRAPPADPRRGTQVKAARRPPSIVKWGAKRVLRPAAQPASCVRSVLAPGDPWDTQQWGARGPVASLRNIYPGQPDVLLTPEGQSWSGAAPTLDGDGARTRPRPCE